MKTFIESNRLVGAPNYHHTPPQDVIYFVNDVTDEDFWSAPQSDSFDPYWSDLQLVDANIVLHEKFGCGVGKVRCEHCSVQYKKCDVDATAKHRFVRSGGCCNSGCSHTFALCKRDDLVAHKKTHLPLCLTCGTLQGACVIQCYACRNTYCSQSQCECRRAAEERERKTYVKQGKCPACTTKSPYTRQGLEGHFQHCAKNLPWRVKLWDKCQCGFFFLDKDHQREHTTGKNKCRQFVAPQVPAAPKKRYDDTLLYNIPSSSPAVQPITDSSNNVFARGIVRLICGAFDTENSPLYTLSQDEITTIKSASEEINKAVGSSGIVAETTGFASADKGTGVSGFCDVDVLVAINGFDPARKADHKKSFSLLHRARPCAG